MSYLGTNADFSKFDRDNIDRTMVLTWINQAKGILAKVLASPLAAQVTNLLTTADVPGQRLLSEVP